MPDETQTEARQTSTPKRRRRPTARVWKRRFLEAYRSNGCNLTLAAKSVGIDRSTAWLARKQDEQFAAALAEIEPEAVEIVENVLWTRCLAGDMRAIEFWLKGHASDRYRERPEVDRAVIERYAEEFGIDVEDVIREVEGIISGPGR